MPEPQIALSPDQKHRIVQKLNEIWQASAHNCPICGNPNWTVGDHLVQPLTVGAQNNDLMFGGIGYPQVMLISIGCGYTIFFNAVMLGAVPSSDMKANTPTVPPGAPNVQS